MYRFSALSITALTALLTLICTSFKIIKIHTLMITSTSLLTPIFVVCYFLILKNFHADLQKAFLHQCLIALYSFSIGVYALVNLPAAEYMHGNPVYQVVFYDIPKRFFATTLSFGISFYAPYFLVLYYGLNKQKSLKFYLLQSIFGGSAFFLLNYLILFYESLEHLFVKTLIDSSLIMATVFLIIMLFVLIHFITRFDKRRQNNAGIKAFIFHLNLILAVIVQFICLACEFRMINVENILIIETSSILFPLVTMANTMVYGLFGLKSSLKYIAYIVLSELSFRLFMSSIFALPSPTELNFSYFSALIQPHNIIANILSLLLVLITNIFVLRVLSSPAMQLPKYLGFLIAQVLASTLLWAINDLYLFPNIYPKEVVSHLAHAGFAYKVIFTVISLPVFMWIYSLLYAKLHKDKISVFTSSGGILAKPFSSPT